MIQVNVWGLTQLTKLFLPGMLERRRRPRPEPRLDRGLDQPGFLMAVYYVTKASSTCSVAFSEVLGNGDRRHRRHGDGALPRSDGHGKSQTRAVPESGAFASRTACHGRWGRCPRRRPGHAARQARLVVPGAANFAFVQALRDDTPQGRHRDLPEDPASLFTQVGMSIRAGPLLYRVRGRHDDALPAQHLPARAPAAARGAQVMKDLHALNQELKSAGAWVFSRGLHGPRTATVVRSRATSADHDGPYVEGKEHVGGIWIIKAPDLDAALGWARKAARAITLPIEVRPFQDRPEAERWTPRVQDRPRVPRGVRPRSGRARCASSATSASPRMPSQDAFAAALERWPRDGLPPSPAGWIITTARNRAIDRLRREASRADRHAQAALLHAADEARRTRGAGARRAPAADLHLLPPRARPPAPRWRSRCGCSAD